MDRSYLSNAGVVAASREFVCIRLATYEDADEAAFCKKLYIGRSGELENTVFAILSPEEKPLVRSGRGPFFAFRNAPHMATEMKLIAADYPRPTSADDAKTPMMLPMIKKLDLALNVASCDTLPVAVVVAPTKERAKEIAADFRETAWQEEFAGQFNYAIAVTEKDRNLLNGLTMTEGVAIVSPDEFGLASKVIEQIPATSDKDTQAAKMRSSLTAMPRRLKNYQQHIQLGIQLGVDWETAIPETDPQSVQARERARGKRE